MEEDVMRRKILVFIAVLVIPILILLADHFILKEDIHLSYDHLPNGIKLLITPMLILKN